jgi:hypothetical protein
LLIKESWLKKVQTKWIKNLSQGHINVLDEIYTLKVTSNNRKLIYDKNNKLIICLGGFMEKLLKLQNNI